MFYFSSPLNVSPRMSSFSKQLSVSLIISYTFSISAWYLYRNYIKYKANKIPTKWKCVGSVEKIILYPLKSGALREVNEAECTDLGLREIRAEISIPAKHLFLDRSFVICDIQHGKALSLVKNPQVTLISTESVDSDRIVFKAPNVEDFILELSKIETHDRVKIKHYGATFDALDCGDDAAKWLSNYFNNQEGSLRLGYYAENISQRSNQINATLKADGFSSTYKHWRKNDGGVFSDLTSYMILTSSTIEDVNNKLANEDKITYRNLRGNIVVRGSEKYAEDEWKWMRIGDEVVFRTVKLCTRCATITVNPDIGERNWRSKILTTLMTYHTVKHLTGWMVEGNKPVLGIHVGLYKPGEIHCNDPVYVDV